MDLNPPYSLELFYYPVAAAPIEESRGRRAGSAAGREELDHARSIHQGRHERAMGEPGPMRRASGVGVAPMVCVGTSIVAASRVRACTHRSEV